MALRPALLNDRPGLRQFLDQLPTAAVVVDGGGKIRYVNSSAEGLFAGTAENLVDRPVEILVPAQLVANHARLRAETQEGHRRPFGAHHDLVGRRLDGSEFPADILLSSVPGDDGPYQVALVADLTNERKHLEESAHLAAIVRMSADAILTLDREGLITSWNRAATNLFKHEPHEVLGSHYGMLLGADARERISEVAAQRYATADFFQVETECVRSDGTTFIAQATVSRLLDAAGEPVGSSAIIHDVTEAVEARRVVLRAKTELEDANSQLRLAFEDALHRLSVATEFRDEETGNHVERMSLYCALLGRKLGWADDRCDILRLASRMHDIGKVGIPDSILRKPGPLTREEQLIMQEHPTIGRKILYGSSSELLEVASVIAWCHHERWDGSGYPRHLRGEQIPIEARIAGLADAFDAMTTDRVYRGSLSLDEALRTLAAEGGRSFDPVLTKLLAASGPELVGIYHALR